jgi:predicted transcriptional regulator of viral defense system
MLYGGRMQKQELISYFQSHCGVAQVSAILKAGFYTDSLNALENEGKVKKIAYGLYRLTDYEHGFNSDLIAAFIQEHRGVICLLSALMVYKMIDKKPNFVDIAIMQGVTASKIKYPAVTFHRFPTEAWAVGIEGYKVEGHKVKIYNIAKTIVDCFKFRDKIGMDVAKGALKVALAKKDVKSNEIMHYADIWRIDSVIKPALEEML